MTETAQEIKPDLNIAKQFITAMTGSPDTNIRVRYLHDTNAYKKDTNPAGEPSEEYSGTIAGHWPAIEVAQQEGFGVFWVPNCTGFTGPGFANKTNVTSFDSLFVDHDAGLPSEFHREPDVTVFSSAGRGHTYWRIQPGSTPEAWTTAQVQLIEHYPGADVAVKNPSRVMRLPGTLHLKNKANPQLVTFKTRATTDLEPPLMAEVIEGLPPVSIAEKMLTAPDIKPDLPGNVATARAYLDKLFKAGTVAIEGRGGNQATYQVCCDLRDNGVSKDVALELILASDWNTKGNQPAWSREQLSAPHEPLDNAYTYAQNAPGAYAVEEPAKTFANATLAPSLEAQAKSDPAASFFMQIDALMNTLDPVMICDPFLIEQELLTVIGSMKLGKTFWTLELLLCVATGLPVLGKYKINLSGPVAYWSAEGRPGIKRRLRAWCRDRGIDYKTLQGKFFYRPDVPRVKDDKDAQDKENRKWLDGIKAEITHNGQRLVAAAVDTLANAIEGSANENTSEMGRYWQTVKGFRDMFGCAILTVGHTGLADDRRLRGWSGSDGTIERQQLMTGPANRKLQAFCLENTLAKDSELFEPIYCKLVDVYLDGDPSNKDRNNISKVVREITEQQYNAIIKDKVQQLDDHLENMKLVDQVTYKLRASGFDDFANPRRRCEIEQVVDLFFPAFLPSGNNVVDQIAEETYKMERKKFKTKLQSNSRPPRKTSKKHSKETVSALYHLTYDTIRTGTDETKVIYWAAPMSGPILVNDPADQ